MSVIGADAVRSQIRLALRGKWAHGTNTYAGLSDERFWAASRSEISELSGRASRTGLLPALGEAYDCDDYAFVLKGIASQHNRSQGRPVGICLGLVWGEFAWLPGIYHAANWALDDTGHFVWIEPQTGQLFERDACRGQVRLVLV